MTDEKRKWTHRNVQSPRLRILIDPVYIQIANLSSSSTYQKYRKLVAELVGRGHYVYWMLPDVDYTPDDIEEHPNVGVIRTEYIQDQFVVDGLVTDDFFNLFNRIAGKHHIDVIVTGRTGAANMIKRVLESPRFHDKGRDFTDKHYGLPMVIVEEFPQTVKSQHVGESYWLAQTTGYMSSDLTVFISDHNRSEVVSGMTSIYRPNTIQKWIDRCEIIPSGIEVAELDNYYRPDRWKQESGFRVMSVGRIMGVSYTQFHEWSKILYEMGVDAKLIVSLSGKLGGPMRKRLEKIGVTFGADQDFYQLIENNPRVNFLKTLRTVHAGIVPMSHLDCPIGISEALYMGVPLVMPTADYQETFFPDYPFVVKPSDRAGLVGHLTFIRENPEEAREMIEPWRTHLRNTFDAPTNNRLLADSIERTAREPIPRFKTSGAILGFLEELKGERYTFDEVIGYLQKCGVMGISIGDLGIRATWTYGRSAIHHAMRYVGFVDLCDGPDEVFVRADIFNAGKTAKSTKVRVRTRKGT